MNIDEREHFHVALADICASHLALKPPQRMTVAQGAAAALMIKRPGDSAIAWSAAATPYMVKPMNVLAARNYVACCFVGPAQSGKTAALGEGWISHVVTNDPGDMLVVQMTEAKAREYSKQRIDRMLVASPKLKELQGTSTRDDNTHDKAFKHGMWLRIAWPTVTNLSSTSYRYVFLTDLDRMPDDLDGEGDPFSLGLKRTTTYLSRGMCAVESSPGRLQMDPNWQPASPHEAPPTTGILSIYNRSDRHRWYWKCLDCREWFEAAPGVGLFNLPSEKDLLDEVRSADLAALAKHHAQVVCPHCGSMHAYKHRKLLNERGQWIMDGQRLTVDDEVIGDALNSNIAGFWLGGVAAAYQSWESLLIKHLQGLREYAMTGSEIALQVAINTDQAMPYMSRHLVDAKGAHGDPVGRAEQDMQRYIVPAWARCLVASVDVQGGVNSRFIVQVHAVGPDMEQQLVNRYEIKDSKRPGMGTEFAQIDPAAHPEDWDVLTEKVVQATYRTEIEGQEMRIRSTVVDSGGEDGVTANAYAWMRRIRKLGFTTRVRLYKGSSVKNAPMIKEVLVGNRSTREKGDVPLLHCNPNLLSDAVDVGLKRQTPGPGYIHFPKPFHIKDNPGGWLPPAFFDELSAEVRGKNGTWTQIRKRNEAFDLCRMIRAGMLYLGLDKVNWSNPPKWLLPLDEGNTEVITSEERRTLQAAVQVEQEVISDAPVRRAARPRRVATSPYLA